MREMVMTLINELCRLLGSAGDFSCASMYANKIVQAADGGFVLAKDPGAETRLWSLVNHGFTKNFHFVHFEKAINAKINGLGAALACGNLDHVEVIDYLSVVSVCLSVRLSVYLFVCLAVYLSVCFPSFPHLFLPVCLLSFFILYVFRSLCLYAFFLYSVFVILLLSTFVVTSACAFEPMSVCLSCR
jgi:hypothetical protein